MFVCLSVCLFVRLYVYLNDLVSYLCLFVWLSALLCCSSFLPQPLLEALALFLYFSVSLLPLYLSLHARMRMLMTGGDLNDLTLPHLTFVTSPTFF